MNTALAPVPRSSPHIQPIEHATFVLSWGDTTFYVDPIGGAEAFAGKPPANFVLVTDIHPDHLNADTIAAVLGDAVLIVPRAVREQLPEALAARAAVLENNETLNSGGFAITATPMYNLPDAANAHYHTKGRGNGYLVEKDGFRVLIAGDTAGTPELRAMRDIDIALIPMNLPYTMGIEEAASTTLEFKPKIVIPYHYRQPDGLADVARFKKIVEAADPNIRVQLLKWY